MSILFFTAITKWISPPLDLYLKCKRLNLITLKTVTVCHDSIQYRQWKCHFFISLMFIALDFTMFNDFFVSVSLSVSVSRLMLYFFLYSVPHFVILIILNYSFVQCDEWSYLGRKRNNKMIPKMPSHWLGTVHKNAMHDNNHY